MGERPMTDPDGDIDAAGGSVDTDGHPDRERAVVLFDHLDTVCDRLAKGNGLLLCTDFDGTLAPIVEDPSGPELTAANEAALRELIGHDRAAVAVVSGRQVDDVASRVGLESVVYAGNHGLELRRDGRTTIHPIAADRAETIERILTDLDDRIGDIDGCVLENKGITATIHYRQVNAEEVPRVEAAVEAAIEAVDGDGIELTAGKAIYEIGPAIPWDKGQLVSLLCEDVPRGWVPAYLGDDTTDESAFRALGEGGIGVYVGGDEPTAARYRVPDPDGVAAAFEWLLDEGLDALGSRPNGTEP